MGDKRPSTIEKVRQVNDYRYSNDVLTPYGRIFYRSIQLFMWALVGGIVYLNIYNATPRHIKANVVEYAEHNSGLVSVGVAEYDGERFAFEMDSKGVDFYRETGMISISNWETSRLFATLSAVVGFLVGILLLIGIGEMANELNEDGTPSSCDSYC